MVFVHRPPEVTPVPAAARRLLEVTLQQALQSLAVTGLVTGHLMDSVVGCVAPATQGELSFTQV